MTETGTPPKSSAAPSTLTYTPTEIRACGKRYILHEPLVCEVVDHGDYYSISHSGLCIISGGATWSGAKQEFSDWFSHTYIRFNELGASRLCIEFRRALCLINRLIKVVHDERITDPAELLIRTPQ